MPVDQSFGHPHPLAETRRNAVGVRSSVAEVIRASPLARSLRRRVIEHPIFAERNLADITANPWALQAFLADCKALPQCGEKQVSIIQTILQDFLLSTPPRKPARNGAGKAEFHVSFMDAIEDVFLRFWRVSYSGRFFYLPSSVPEMVKIDPVLRSELPAGISIAAYTERISAIYRASLVMNRPLAGTVLLNSAALEAILCREHRYVSHPGR